MRNSARTVRRRYDSDHRVCKDRIQELCKEGVISGLSMFHSLKKQSPEMKTSFRMVWVLCWGIPLRAWDTENAKKIVGSVGEFKDVDDDVENLWRVNRTRVLVKTVWSPLTNHSVTAKINGVDFAVKIVEETCYKSRRCRCSRWNFLDSLEKISFARVMSVWRWRRCSLSST